MGNKAKQFVEQVDQVRPVTRDLIDAVLMDAWPRNAAVIDFGLDSQKHYEALYYPIREREIMPRDLDAALGDGEKLTALARQAPSNPHKDVRFYTSWDGLSGRPKPEGALSEADKLRRVLTGELKLEPAPDAGRVGGRERDRGIER